MSDDPLEDVQLPRRTTRLPFWSMWGRETAKDFALLLAAIPVVCVLIYVPVLATSGGSWPRLVGLLLLFVAIWCVLRVVLHRWVAAGTGEAGDPPSRG
ncbi:hypothetical protein N5P18_02795 [Janibacter terrae]|uniref:Uncharacterized protein n=1 Tax=Janibacter terrae TaxID=103817 RepID=A0ABZ2FI53_9MICO|nr:hypothetical protein [Janibacter terrae]MBA4085274.1 hypothetical protein [Kytococcus sp.]